MDARLAEIEGELARLRARHDNAMSSFRFDEANALQHDIAALEGRRRALAGELPPVAAPAEGVIPVMLKPRRMGRPRRRR